MSLLGVFSVSASGMEAQRIRAELLAENIANADTTRTPEGGPYRRKDAIVSAETVSSPFAASLQSELDPRQGTMTGATVHEVLIDSGEPEQRYVPGHPDADASGYVKFPKLNPAEEMVNLMGASRNYQANVAAMAAVKEMIHRSIDLFR